MKKLFSALIILASVLMLSGCFFYVEDNSSSSTPPKYAITFCNFTDDDVVDWYVKNSSGERFFITEGFNIVTEGSQVRLKDLRKDDYKVYYSFIPDSYYESNYVKLDENIKFVLTKKTEYSFKSE